MTAEGQTYVVGQGPALKAGDVRDVQLHGPAAHGHVASKPGAGAGRGDPYRGRVGSGQRAPCVAGGRQPATEAGGGRRDRLFAI